MTALFKEFPSRRSVITGGVGAALIGGLGWRAYDRGVFAGTHGAAYAPWDTWMGHPGEGIKRPLHAALVASNAHNSQPWLFTLGDDRISIYADRSRNLGAADPFGRELTLSLGCALANFQVAADHYGYGLSIHINPGRLEPTASRDPVEVAHILLKPGEAGAAPLKALFDTIGARHTNRGPYLRKKPIPAVALESLFGAYGNDVRIVPLSEQARREDISSIIMEATERFCADAQMSADAGHWYRTGMTDVLKHRDGVVVDAAGLTPWRTAMAKLLPDQSIDSANQYWRDATRMVQIPTAALFGLVLVRDRMDVVQAVTAGRAWQLCQLTATHFGLAAQPLNQPVEMADRNLVLGRQDFYKSALTGLTDWKDWDATFVFRLGFAERPGPLTPRRPLADVLRKTGMA